jgi:hypothetical protein
MKRIGIILAPTTFFMALYFLLSTILIERERSVVQGEENETTEVVNSVPEDEELKNKRPKVPANTQLD